MIADNFDHVDGDQAFEAIASLEDQVRRGLYRFVRSQPRPVTRQEAAGALRISAKLAAFHLDKLVERGLLDADHRLPEGFHRRVGRAPKRYRPSGLEVSLSLPERRYDLIGTILVDALAHTDTAESPPPDLARRIAWQHGQHLGAEVRQERRLGRPGAERTVAATQDLLDRNGYEPVPDGTGGLVLRNCPFHALVGRAPELICSINVAFIDGLLRGLGNDTVRAELAPVAGSCCVRVLAPRA
jgi:predicted ArsR family transcriptional regulator